MPIAAAIPALVGVGTAIYGANQQKKAANKALDAQRAIAENIKYEPINIEALKASATQQAIENATGALALERNLAPDVAAVRTELARQVNEELALGGKLSADTINRIQSEGRVIGGRSGVGASNTVPVTAALVGLESMDLANQRRGAAASLLAANPLPGTGLDPATVADLEVAQNAAYNQFNLEKAGVDSSLVESERAARSAQIGGQLGAISSIANLIGQGVGAIRNQPTNVDKALKRTASSDLNLNQNPALNPILSRSPLGLA